jgi:hypothetical protein
MKKNAVYSGRAVVLIRITLTVALLSAGAIFLVSSFARTRDTGRQQLAQPNTSPTPKPHPTGYYYLLATPNDPAEITSSASNPNLDGWRVRLSWKDIQPDDADDFEWQKVDDLIAAAGSKGIGISISAGIVCPDWVYTSVPQVYKYTLDPSTGTVNDDVAGPPPYSEPLPWDQNFQQKWETFVTAFGAKYDGNPAVRYVLVTGFMQLVNATLIANIDGSDTFVDGKSSGTYSYYSATANFVGSGPNSDVGRVLSSPTTRPNSLISSVTDARNVILDKLTDFGDPGNITNQTFYIYGRHPGMGDDYQVNQLAKNGSPQGGPGYWIGYSDIDPETGNGGYASTAAYLDAAPMIADYFFAAFPRTPVVLSPAAPFPLTNPYSQDANFTVRDYVRDHTNGGTCYTNLQAIIPPYPARMEVGYAKIQQAIHPSNQTDQLYASPTPSPTVPPPPQPLIDLLESGYSKGDQALELYGYDLLSTDSCVVSILTGERAKLIGANPVPVQLNSVVSKKIHGGAGTYNINLPMSGTAGIECRNGGTSGDYQIVFTFSNNLTNVCKAIANCGTVSSSSIGPNANQYTVSLTGQNSCNQSYNFITLTNVDDSAGHHSDVVLGPQWGLLIGDVNADRAVNSTDANHVQSHGGPVTPSNFRDDVTVDGTVNNADKSLVQSKFGTSLPP